MFSQVTILKNIAARGSIASWKAPMCSHKLLFSKILQQVQVRRGTCSILGGSELRWREWRNGCLVIGGK